METKSREPKKYPILIYFLLAYGITWLCWLPGLIVGHQKGYLMPNFNTYHILFETGFENTQHLGLAIVFFFGVYGPLIGGFIATWIDGKKEGLAEWWRQITHWNIESKWYLNSLVITFLIAAIPVAILGIIGGFSPSNLAITYIIGLILVQLLRSGLGEEPGWRGFLLPRLREQYEGDKYIWILGLVWAVWHFPIVSIEALSMMPNVPIAQSVVTVLISLAGNVMALIGISFIYAWLYNNTKSVFLAIVFHALSNVFVFWLPSYLESPGAAGLAAALMPWVVVIIMQKRLGKEVFY